MSPPVPIGGVEIVFPDGPPLLLGRAVVVKEVNPDFAVNQNGSPLGLRKEIDLPGETANRDALRPGAFRALPERQNLDRRMLGIGRLNFADLPKKGMLAHPETARSSKRGMRGEGRGVRAEKTLLVRTPVSFAAFIACALFSLPNVSSATGGGFGPPVS